MDQWAGLLIHTCAFGRTGDPNLQRKHRVIPGEFQYRGSRDVYLLRWSLMTIIPEVDCITSHRTFATTPLG